MVGRAFKEGRVGIDDPPTAIGVHSFTVTTRHG
jgi:hypothetical protein